MAYIELPDFVTEATVSRAYHRSRVMQQRHRAQPSGYSRAWRDRGVRAARARNPKLLLWLEKAAEILRSMNDAQQSRFSANEHGVEFAKQDFTEFATFRESLTLAADKLRPGEEGDPAGCDPEVFGWVYGASAEAVFGPL